jgi:hypothetical protein
VAVDMADGQAANNTVRLIGAAFGPASVTSQPGWVGTGLGLFDSGMTMAQVSERVVSLMGAGSTADFVNRVYANVVGAAPGDSERATYVGMLEAGLSQVELLTLAANTQINADRINLSGLQQSGVDYA